ncbi:MAG: SUMF1/EgtB/PvdO family nonheme iron enzyme, partial [Myxococcales bacterium]|nr:SUMF1/EgtB/PvdO family nonheme iron enzyme [Myxococcales bacterium]
PVAEAPAAPEAPAGPPPGMVEVPAGMVHPGLSAAAREKALAQCKVDLEGYPISFCTERLDQDAEAPPRPVAAFFIDRYEVAQEGYSQCLTAGVCLPLRLTWELSTQPATGVTRDMAAAYCAWRGGRLPTADEWLHAARGDDERLFPWGDEAPGAGDKARANYGRFTHKGGLPERIDRQKYAAPVDTYGDRGASPLGVANLSGNVREWTSTEADGQGVVMGGGWREAPFELRVTRRERMPLDGFKNDLGFRCVMDLPGER